MSALLARPSDGAVATTCVAYGTHRPLALRFVWHHLLPEVAGGATDNANLIEVCDSCHLAIHDLMWALKQHDGDEAAAWGTVAGMLARKQYARQGYALAVALGTTAKIPNEGGILS